MGCKILDSEIKPIARGDSDLRYSAFSYLKGGEERDNCVSVAFCVADGIAGEVQTRQILQLFLKWWGLGLQAYKWLEARDIFQMIIAIFDGLELRIHD